MNFWNKICGVALVICFTTHEALSQSRFTRPLPLTVYNIQDSLRQSPKDSDAIFFQSHRVVFPATLTPVAENYLVSHYAFFCRQELHFQKLTKIPLKIRLGSVAQCDYYEGKDR